MLKKIIVLTLSSLFLTSTALAQTEVDLELLLSIDISGSINADEFELQRQGYIDAFDSQKSPDIVNAIIGSDKGIAVGLTYWASLDQFLEIPWKHLKDENSIEEFITEIVNLPTPTSGTEGIGGTSINQTIKSSIEGFPENDRSNRQNGFLNNEFVSSNLILDISGDEVVQGEQNINSIEQERDKAEEENIVINGLPIETSTDSKVDELYKKHVITSDGFTEPATGLENFGNAVKKKLEREIVGTLNESITSPEPQSTPEPSVLIGFIGISIFGNFTRKRR